MSYESDYRYRQQSTKGANPGDRLEPRDLSSSRGSGKALLIAAVAIVAFIAFVALMSVTGAPESGAPVTENGTTQAIPNDGSAGGAEITPAPATGE
jgi:hypothetical protein